MSRNPLRVAIIGCGKIADQHALAIDRIPGSVIVALCDREPLMARQLGERCGVERCFSDATEMLREVRPDVVHITTPPQSHEKLALECLDAGSHVYLEKPFTVTAEEAERIFARAEQKGLKVVAGHNYQFTLEMLGMRRLVEEGFLGGTPVHLESHWAYDLSDRVYVGALLGNSNHWVRRLPGRLFHNLISHGIARLAEFLDDEIVELRADAHQSPALRSIGGGDVDDELRVMIRDARGTTAYFTFSTQIKPGINQFRVCGPERSILVDQGSGSLIRERIRTAKSYLTFVLPPLYQARERFLNAPRNLYRFLKRDLYHDSGMKETIDRFHRSIVSGDGADLPISPREILLTARIMDAIFGQLYPGERQEGVVRVPAPQEAGPVR